ncbi:hypothetical protein AYI68_g1795 [Smittium mucronatum]|uniref:Uncharacterized protein n=1 Tax=Smittium mucronatum TaxID=133383 RepID=A0A1R0H4Q8_9FUNG|nr:hypothetical protein AYI68_g1795 [Smittium mucronatum]
MFAVGKAPTQKYSLRTRASAVNFQYLEEDWWSPPREDIKEAESEFVQFSSFWDVSKPPDAFQDPETSSGMGKIQFYGDFGIPRRTVDSGRDQEYFYDPHLFGLIQDH